MIRLLGFAVLALVASSCGDASETRVPCTSQAQCGVEQRRVCEQGFCGALLPDPSLHLETLTMTVPVTVRLAEPKSLRAAVLYAHTPDGKHVVCPGKAAASNDVAIPSMAALYDRAKFNVTAPMLEMPLRSLNDTIQTAVGVNGAGRVLYVELYADSVTQNEPESGGPAIAVGCLADVPYADDPNAAPITLGLTLAP